MGSVLNMMDMLQIVIFAYLLYCGVVGKGAPYKDDTIRKDKKEEYRKLIRLFCLICGPVGLASVLLYSNGYALAGWILYGLSLLFIVALIVLTYRMTSRRNQKKAGEDLSAAFEDAEEGDANKDGE